MPTKFDRITIDSGRCGGQPTVRDLRIPVATIVREVAAGRSNAQVLDAYPELEIEDIRQALAYAAWLATGSFSPHPNEAA
jgi:uncharacterized protein (DUF433 family)